MGNVCWSLERIFRNSKADTGERRQRPAQSSVQELPLNSTGQTLHWKETRALILLESEWVCVWMLGFRRLLFKKVTLLFFPCNNPTILWHPLGYSTYKKNLNSKIYVCARRVLSEWCDTSRKGLFLQTQVSKI